MIIQEYKHNPKLYRNGWCGPAALSLLTGETSEDCAALIRKRFKKRKCTGTTWEQVEYVLKKHKFKSKVLFATSKRKHYVQGLGLKYHEGNPPTLVNWFEWHRVKLKPNECYLISCGSHWMIELDGLVYDNRNPKGVPITESHKKKARVNFAVKLIHPHKQGVE